METLNLLSDSNRLLREERDRQLTKMKELEAAVERLEGEVGPLKETNRQLVAQKDALVAEKTALRYVYGAEPGTEPKPGQKPIPKLEWN